jgi:penicillin-binding protein 1C
MHAKNSRYANKVAALGAIRARRARDRADRVRRRRSLAVGIVTTLLGFTAFVVTLVAATPVIAAAVAYQMYGKDVEAGLAKLENLDERQGFQSNRVYDRNGVLLLEFWGEGRRIKVPLEQISPLLISATVATEDKTFWTNNGVDPQAILRAALQNHGAGGIRSGASTITQQLVRMLVFSVGERTSQSYHRKIKEVALAYLFNRLRSKREILALYLNEVNYGHLSYGIEAAAQTYFGKHAADLDLAEASLLAGLPQMPAELDPLDPAHATAAKARQRIVLGLMVRQGYVTQAQANLAFAEDLQYQQPVVSLHAPHFVNYVREQLVQLFGVDRVARGGLVVTTTLDLRLQDQVQQIALQHVLEVSETKHLTNASVVVTRPDTGEILAMVGSANYWDASIDGQVNVATAERQPGSSIKPLLYSLAFEQGLTPGAYIYDQAIQYTIPGAPLYEPVNYDGAWHGHVTLRTALANSLNIPATKLMHFVGVRSFIEFAHRMGITGLNRGSSWYGISLALGGGEVTLVDMVTAYGVLANQGSLVRPTPFLEITDSDGKRLYRLAPQPKPVLDPRIAFMVGDILSDNQARAMEFGANSLLRVSRPAAVKTGTTNDWKDNWTIGFTPYVLVGVWAGNADNTSMRHSTGVTGAAPIWHDTIETIFANPQYLQEFYPAGDPPLEFHVPEGVVKTTACVPIGVGGCRTATDWFLADQLPGKDASGQVWLWLSNVTTKTIRVLNLSTDSSTDEPSYCLPQPDQNIPDTALSDIEVPDLSVDMPAGARRLIETLDNVSRLVERDEAAPAEGDSSSAEPLDCTGEQIEQFVAAGGLAGIGNVDAVWTIASPRAGDVITQSVPILGTVRFNYAGVQYYKVEIAAANGSTEPDNWAYLGGGRDPVENGVLATLPADALPPGDYVLRLVLVQTDGNFPPPYSVSITIGLPGP